MSGSSASQRYFIEQHLNSDITRNTSFEGLTSINVTLENEIIIIKLNK